MNKKKSANSKKRQQPIIAKYTGSKDVGIYSFSVTRYVIGYVVNGTKCIYYGDVRQEVPKGGLFFLSRGEYFVEDICNRRNQFEQVLFFYSPEQHIRVLAILAVSYGYDTHTNHICSECYSRNYLISNGWPIIKHFFSSVHHYVNETFFRDNETSEFLKLTELIYLIVSQPDNCLKSRVLRSINQRKEFLEQSVFESVFTNISMEELAKKNNMSLSAFKKEFRLYFKDSPHRWVTRQRLKYSQILLTSTDKTIREIGAECHFPNTSHYIKIFHKEFGDTPCNYRRKFNGETPEYYKITETENKVNEPVLV
jgi:AraC-like DNA-binding protein